jgi:hypothetical protein
MSVMTKMGHWQFLCGGNEHTTPEEVVLIHTYHMFDLHPELKELLDLPRGMCTEQKSVSEKWIKAPIPRRSMSRLRTLQVLPL